jgi:hypothetical protein
MYNKYDKIVTQIVNLDLLLYKSEEKQTIKKYKTINPEETIISIKQLIKTLRKIRNKPKTKLYIYVEDVYLLSLVKLIVKKLKLTRLTILQDTKFKIVKQKKEIFYVICLGLISDSVISNFLQKKFYLLNFINIRNTDIYTGVYKMYNQIDNMKKIIWLLSLIQIVLTKKYAYKS